ncbi:YihY/virulence factor BrkB family protein [Actinoplanes sp. CA-051413]|uniref:YihY/virulence factor BrkB family protein n=1 Tax=Actinoplanes sp. CA-051413 TaxID=3239899 RepID=UPI003D99F09C
MAAIGRRMAEVMSRILHRLDMVQRRHRVLGFPWAVFRKYSDDDGPRLAAQLTYYGFLSVFPLLLLATAAVTELLRGQPEWRSLVLDRLVRPQLRPGVEQALADLPSSGVPFAVGLVGLLFSGTGGVLAVYFAVNKMWGVAWRDRFGLVSRWTRVLLVLALSFVTGVLAAGSTVVTDTVLRLPAVQRGAGGIATGVAVFAVIVVVHKVLVCRPVRLGDMWVGGAVAATTVTALLHTAATVLPALITRAGLVYGSFATVVGVFTLLYLMSQALVLGVEISTVAAEGLSPRGLTDAELTAMDQRALVLLARRQERVPGQHVTTSFAADPGRTYDL